MRHLDIRFGRAMMDRKISEATREAGVSADEQVDKLRRKVGTWLIASVETLMARRGETGQADPKTT